MKLLLLFHHYRTGAERGGHRSSMIARCLKSAGYSVTAIVPGIDSLSGKAHSSMGDSWKSISYDQGVKVVRVRGTKNNRSSVFARIMYYVTSSIMQFFTALRERDVCLVMCTSMPLTSLIFSYLIAKIRRVPFIIDVRDLNIDAAIESGYLQKGILTSSLLYLEKVLMRSADMIFTVSEGFANLLTKDKGVDRKKIVFIPIGMSSIAPNHSGIREELINKLKSNDAIKIMYAGTMGYIVDIPAVLDMALLTRDTKYIEYWFIGDGQRLKEYQERAKREELNCHFVGAYSRQQTLAILQYADLCVYPLVGGPVIRASLGNKFFDYLELGKPILYLGQDGEVAQRVCTDAIGWTFDSPSKAAKFLVKPEILEDIEEITTSITKKSFRYERNQIEKQIVSLVKEIIN